MGRKGIRRLKERESAALAEGARLNSGGIQAGGVRGGSHSVTSRDTASGAPPGVRAAKNSEFGEGE